MRKSLLLIVPVMLIAGLMFSCSDNDNNNEPEMRTLTLNFNGLTDLGSDFDYEGWIVVDGAPKSTGTFTVDAEGNPSDTTFDINKSDLDAATKFILTIEPVPDTDPNPSNTHYLAGEFSDNVAVLTVADPAVFGNDFTSATGTYILATPTNGTETNENSGIWFLDAEAGPGPGLSFPTTLPNGWKYEGWAVIGGVPVTTGKFVDPDGADEAAPYSGEMNGPPFPGEDFLMNAPDDLTFPTDLAGDVAVITIEPDPDNSEAPFALKPLIGQIPSDATDHTNYDMATAADVFPVGMASR